MKEWLLNMTMVRIKQATKQGYALCEVGGWLISAIQTVKQGEEEYKGTGKFAQL